MTVCCICGSTGDFTRVLGDQADCPICNDCHYYVYKARQASSDEEKTRIIDPLLRNPQGTAKAKDYLIELLDPTVAAQRRMLEEELRRVEGVVRTMPITSGTSFEGYKIIRYGGYVSGDEVVSLSDQLFFGTSFSKDAINEAIKQCRMTAIKELKQAAALQECNAIIGLDFDYINIDRTIGNTNITHIILTANGTAVQIEKI